MMLWLAIVAGAVAGFVYEHTAHGILTGAIVGAGAAFLVAGAAYLANLGGDPE